MSDEVLGHLRQLYRAARAGGKEELADVVQRLGEAVRDEQAISDPLVQEAVERLEGRVTRIRQPR